MPTKVIDFLPHLAARRAGEALPHEKKVTFAMNFFKWPLSDVAWLADRLDEADCAPMAENLRLLIEQEKAAAS
jgi:hypothetical protein